YFACVQLDVPATVPAIEAVPSIVAHSMRSNFFPVAVNPFVVHPLTPANEPDCTRKATSEYVTLPVWLMLVCTILDPTDTLKSRWKLPVTLMVQPKQRMRAPSESWISCPLSVLAAPPVFKTRTEFSVTVTGLVEIVQPCIPIVELKNIWRPPVSEPPLQSMTVPMPPCAPSGAPPCVGQWMTCESVQLATHLNTSDV